MRNGTSMTTTHIKIHIAPLGHNSTIEIDGEDISHKIDGAWVASEVATASTVVVRYVDVDVEIEGDVEGDV